MKKVIDYETALDDIEFGFWPEEGEPDEGELHVLEPSEMFERACVDTIDNLRLAMREELMELGERVEWLERLHQQEMNG